MKETRVRPLTLIEELEVEAMLVPNRRGKLYALAAKEIKRLRLLIRRWNNLPYPQREIEREARKP